MTEEVRAALEAAARLAEHFDDERYEGCTIYDVNGITYRQEIADAIRGLVL